MSVTYFQPEVWSATLLSILAKTLVFAGAPCVNRDYEGDISAYGDTVHITNVADVNIFAYTKDTDLTAAQALTDAEQLLLINQAFGFNFEVDDIDMRQVRSGGALMAEAAKRAAFGLADNADKLRRRSHGGRCLQQPGCHRRIDRAGQRLRQALRPGRCRARHEQRPH